MSDVRTVKIKFKDLVFLEDNPRTIKKESLERLAKRIQDDPAFFEARPCLVNFTDGKYICYGGFQRGHAAAKILKWKEVPCSVENDVATDVMRRRAILDNTHDGEWDSDVLANQWSDFSMEELGEMGVPEWVFGGDGDEGETPNNALNSEAQEDDFEPPEIETVKTDIVLGDLFEIGPHRVLCGDAKVEATVAVLMNKEKADLVVTDPPYNTGMKASKDAKAWLSQMFNDSFTPDQWSELKAESFKNYDRFTKGECAFYVFIDWRRVAEFKSELERIADVKNVIVWDKGVHGLGSDYKSTYENIVVGKKGKPQISNRIGLDYQDIWRVQRKMGRDEDHATKKPIALLSKPILHASKMGDIVLDLFGGSGSTMVTSHQLGRRAYLLEIEPKYCQIILDRMLKLDPTLEIKKNGQPYKSPNVADLA